MVNGPAVWPAIADMNIDERRALYYRYELNFYLRFVSCYLSFLPSKSNYSSDNPSV